MRLLARDLNHGWFRGPVVSSSRRRMAARITKHFVMIAGALALIALSGCEVRQQMDAKFGDQHFKTAVALIELYHLRHGQYPAALSDLDFSGEWDAIALSSVRYQRLPEGYELNLARGWVGQPTVAYPDAFWRGLGIRRTNVGRMPPAATNPPS